MQLTAPSCRERLEAARVGRLATAGADRRPHLVPITFAVLGDRLVTAVDQKPKTTTALRRLRNIAENPSVSVLCDHYADDWTQLWWVRVDGVATLLGDGDGDSDSDSDRARPAALAALAAKYPQYQQDPPRGPVISVDIERLTGWCYRG